MTADIDASATEKSPLTGIGLKIASVTVFMVMASCIKAAGSLPPGELVFFRSFFAMFPILAFLAMRGQLRSAFSTSRPLGHITRGLVGVSAMACSFYGLTHLPLPDAIAIGYAKPMIVVVFGALFLGETIRIYRWSAVLIGLAGVLIISWPKLTLVSGESGFGNTEFLGVLATLTAATLAACAMILVRRLVSTEQTPTIVLWFSLTATMASLLTLPFGWDVPSTRQLTLLLVAGFSGGAGQILLTQSYRYAEMSTIAPFEYVSMLLAIAIGIFAFGDIPTLEMLVGGAIVMAAGIFIIYREQRLGLKRTGARRYVTPQG